MKWIVLCLAGVLVGMWLRQRQDRHQERVRGLELVPPSSVTVRNREVDALHVLSKPGDLEAFARHWRARTRLEGALIAGGELCVLFRGTTSGVT